jgi:hypothetical protein
MQDKGKKNSEEAGIHGFIHSLPYPSGSRSPVPKKEPERVEGLWIPFIVTG